MKIIAALGVLDTDTYTVNTELDLTSSDGTRFIVPNFMVEVEDIQVFIDTVNNLLNMIKERNML